MAFAEYLLPGRHLRYDRLLNQDFQTQDWLGFLIASGTHSGIFWNGNPKNLRQVAIPEFRAPFEAKRFQR